MQLELISRHPEGAARTTPVLFVHGAWHSAWCWEKHFLGYFARRGYHCHALSLRGHGASAGRASLRFTRLADYVADVAQIAHSMPVAPVVVGHSMGGAVVQHYLARHPAPAGVLLASVPPAGALHATLRIAARHPLRFLWANLSMSLYPLVATPVLAREAFLSTSVPQADVDEIWQHLQDESFMAFLDMLAFNLPKPDRVDVPMLVAGAAGDTVFGVREVAATARAYRTTETIFDDMAHDVMLEPGWQRVADRIIDWLADRVP